MKTYLHKLMIASAILMSLSFGLSKVLPWVSPKEWVLLVGVMATNSFLAVYPIGKIPSKDPAVVYLWGTLFRLLPVALLLVWTARSFAQNTENYLITAIITYILFLLLEIPQLQKSISLVKANK